MEVGRRSMGSDSREGRKKKLWALPLATFLSFNDRDVHPECPNASNAFHKCGRHCVNKIPSRKFFMDTITSEEDRGKKAEIRGVNLNCPNASNPYHKCAEYCFEKLPDKRKDAGNNQPAMKPKGEKKQGFTTDRLVKNECKNASHLSHVCDEYCLENIPVRDQPGKDMPLKSSREVKKLLRNKERTGSLPLCKHTSNPYHECTSLCFQSVQDNNLAEKAIEPREESEIVAIVNPKMKLECKNASNPNHLCTENCFQSVSNENSFGQAVRLKNLKKEENVLNIRETTDLDPKCKYASNPQHVCTKTCFQDVPQRKITLRENPEGVPITADKNLTSSNHKITDNCFEDIIEKDQSEVVKPKQENEIVVIDEEHVVNLECKNASNPSHVCTKYCFQSLSKLELHKQDTEPKNEKIVLTAKLRVNSLCKNASNPYHACTEDCFQNLPVKGQLGEAVVKSRDDNKVVASQERVVNSQCKNASNPYHVCAEYCLHDMPKGHHLVRALTKSKEEKKAVSSMQRVNSECKNASNPYHVCAEYCFEDVLGRDKQGKSKTFATMKSKEKVKAVRPPELGNPDCRFASNPYHACAEYCFQNVSETEKHREVMKLKSIKELKNLVSNKKINGGHPQCTFASNPYHECTEYCITKNVSNSNIPDGVTKTNAIKKEDNHSQRRDFNPNCKQTSNSFHRHPECCSEEITVSPKDEEVEGVKETFKEKKRDSFEETARHDPITEQTSSMTSGFRRIILQHGTEKSSAESKHDNNSDLSDEAKDLQSAKLIAMRNFEELEDVQPLQLIKASDLFQEWAKYCSQKKTAAADEIVMQESIVGLGELSTRNGKENVFLNDFESEKLEKVHSAGGLPLSLPISLLFFLGFLFALLCWTQVIYSLVMSSEKNQGHESLKLDGDRDHKCRNASDPYHYCSDCCFRGMGEGMQ